MADKKPAPEKKEAKEETACREANWNDLAQHFQVKVQKRTSEVSFLHTKAGFLIAAAAVFLQAAYQLDGAVYTIQILAPVLALSGLLALSLAVASMFMAKAPSALDADDMIVKLLENPQLEREKVSRWLARSYADTNREFNKVYNKKDSLQRLSAGCLVFGFIILTVIKGVQFYG